MLFYFVFSTLAGSLLFTFGSIFLLFGLDSVKTFDIKTIFEATYACWWGVIQFLIGSVTYFSSNNWFFIIVQPEIYIKKTNLHFRDYKYISNFPRYGFFFLSF